MGIDKDVWLKDSKNILKWKTENLPEDGLCPILKSVPDRWVVDHDHFTGQVRGVISNEANCNLEGRIQKIFQKYIAHKTDLSLSEVLRNLADYLEQDFSDNPLHHRFKDDMVKFLHRCTIPTIIRRADEDFGLKIPPDSSKIDCITAYIQSFVKWAEENRECYFQN